MKQALQTVTLHHTQGEVTDDDITDCRTAVKVDGGVYFLFRGGRSQNLVDHLSGKLLTAEFDLDQK